MASVHKFWFDQLCLWCADYAIINWSWDKSRSLAPNQNSFCPPCAYLHNSWIFSILFYFYTWSRQVSHERGQIMYCQDSHPFSNLCQLLNIVFIHVVMKKTYFSFHCLGSVHTLQDKSWDCDLLIQGQAYNLHQSESIVHPKLELFKNSPYRGESWECWQYVSKWTKCILEVELFRSNDTTACCFCYFS